MITELGDKATTSTAEAAALTDRRVKAASEAVTKAPPMRRRRSGKPTRRRGSH
ncbi:hypothetical protein [Gordonia rhizosphera]